MFHRTVRKHIQGIPRYLHYARSAYRIGRNTRNAVRAVSSAVSRNRKRGRRGTARVSIKKTKRGGRTLSGKTIANAGEGFAQHNDLSSAYLKYVHGRLPRGYRSVAKSCLQHQFGAVSLQGSGQQLVTTIAHFVTRPQIMDATGTVGVASNDSWPANPWDMNPSQKTTGSGILTAAGTPNLDQCYLHAIRGELNFTNLENIATEIEVYLVMYKVTTEFYVTQCWNNILTTTGNQYQGSTASVQSTVAAGIVGNATYGFPSVNTYGQMPFTHPAMRRMFKICWKQKHKLAPGATKRININIQYNRMLNKEYFNRDATGADGTGDYMKGYTLALCYIAKSAPVKDTSVSGSSRMTPGPTEIGYEFCYNVYLSYPPTKRLYAYRTDAGFVNETVTSNMGLMDDTDNVDFVRQT